MFDRTEFCIDRKDTIRDAFRKMDLNKKKFVVVVDDHEKVIGFLTDGDIRREIWKGTSLSESIDEVMRRDFVYCESENDVKKINQSFISSKIKQIPILQDGRLISVVYKDHFNAGSDPISLQHLDMPVVIMAGGKGTRLDPFTKILPKALIPVGEKPIIEIIINNFQAHGMIQAFFDDYHEGLKLSFIQEEKPLGTVGSLRLMPMERDKTIIVTNCDIIIKHDYSTIARFHKQEKYDITIVASMRHYKIPYGVCELTNGADLIDINEKPEYDFLVNTGMYLVEPNMLDYIPENEYFDMTDLIKKAKQRNHKIGVYPISEKSWVDIGQWEQYHEAVKEL